MRNRNRGAPAHQVVQGPLNFLFGFGVHGRSRLVQNQNARVDQQSPRNRNALALTPRQTLSALTHQRVVALWHAQDEFVGMGGSGGRHNVFTARLGFAVSDVVGDRAKEQERFLQHQADLTAVIGHFQLPDVDSIELNRAFGQVVKAADQVDQRALARTTVAHQANHLPGLYIEVELANHRAVAIAKACIAHRDVALHWGGQSHGFDGFGHAGDVVEDVKNAFGTRRGFLSVRDNPAHGIQSAVKATDVGQKSGQHTHRDLVVRDQPDAKAPDHQQADLGHQSHCGREQRPDTVQAVIDQQVVLVGILETLGFAVFLRKSLDHPDAWNGVGQHVGDFSPDAVNLLETSAQFLAHHMDQPSDERQGQQGDQGQGRVDGEQDDGRHQNHQHVGRKVQQVKRYEHVDSVRLAADSGNQIACAASTKIFQREFQQMLVSGGAQIGANALRHQGQYVSFGPTQAPCQQGRAQQPQKVERNQPRIDGLAILVRDQDVIHQGHGQVRGHQSRRRSRQSEQKTCQQ